MWSRLLRCKVVALAACVAALLALFAPRSAAAATLVPMCGEHAETVAAPPIVPALETTVLRASPCSERGDGLRFGAAPDPTAPERVAQVETVPRMPPVRHSLPAHPLAERSAREAARSGERSGFPRAIERPPCA